MLYDLIIIGGGPAGLTAGIYARRANLKTIILEKDTIGGQISSSPCVENYPGYEKISGADLSQSFYKQVINAGCEFEFEEVQEIKAGHIKEVVTDSTTYKAKAVIIATGGKPRLLGLENEEELIGNGIHFCALCDGSFYKDERVAIVGGGNTAIVDAEYLSGLCEKVYILCKDDKLGGDRPVIERLLANDKIAILYNTELTAYPSEDEITEVEINKNGKKEMLEVSGVFMAIGYNACTNLADSLKITKDDRNYILSDDLTTECEGIFIAGDCRSKKIRQVTTAASDGSIAASLANEYIKANTWEE